MKVHCNSNTIFWQPLRSRTPQFCSLDFKQCNDYKYQNITNNLYLNDQPQKCLEKIVFMCQTETSFLPEKIS